MSIFIFNSSLVLCDINAVFFYSVHHSECGAFKGFLIFMLYLFLNVFSKKSLFQRFHSNIDAKF